MVSDKKAFIKMTPMGYLIKVVLLGLLAKINIEIPGT
jgi:hypothetical protein